jgi:endonuclease/exonuclease/phosphatase family metal-dependent hydrolase
VLVRSSQRLASALSIDGAHEYNLQRAIDTIAKIGPDLVGLKEVTRNHPLSPPSGLMRVIK